MRHFGGVLKKEEIIISLKNHKLFANVNESDLLSLISSDDNELKTFKTGEEIFSPQSKEKKLGFVLEGEANVYSNDGTRSVILKTLSENEAFGVSNLFDKESNFVSLIVARKATTVIFFTSKAIGNLLDVSAEFRSDYVSFLSEKIRFLNKKISCFTAGSPERKLAVFLCSQNEQKCFSLNINANMLSEMLNVGRASLYRAFDKLENDGLITKNGKLITVIDRKTLQKNYIEM